MELSTVHGLLLLVIGVAIVCYSAQYVTLLRPTGLKLFNAKIYGPFIPVIFDATFC